jgi:hypothetical protein
MSVIIDAGLTCCISVLQPEIEQIAQITIAVFALHKCGDSGRFSDHLMVMAAHWLALDGDFGVANGDDAVSRSALSASWGTCSADLETALWCVTASATRFNGARKMSGALGVHL